MRIIDADELIEHAWRDKLDSRELIVKMIQQAPTVKSITAKIPIKDLETAFRFGMALGFGEKYDETDKVLDEIKKILTPKPKTGHWITTRTFMHDGENYCDKCKCESPNNEKWNFCPNCGADMREVES